MEGGDWGIECFFLCDGDAVPALRVRLRVRRGRMGDGRAGKGHAHVRT